MSIHSLILIVLKFQVHFKTLEIGHTFKRLCTVVKNDPKIKFRDSHPKLRNKEAYDKAFKPLIHTKKHKTITVFVYNVEFCSSTIYSQTSLSWISPVPEYTVQLKEVSLYLNFVARSPHSCFYLYLFFSFLLLQKARRQTYSF